MQSATAIALIALAACGPTLEDDRPFIPLLPFGGGPYYVDVGNGRFGGLALTEVSANKVLLEFGAVRQPAGVISPRMVMPLVPYATLPSPTTGIVMSVERNLDSGEVDDYEVRMRAHDYSRWEIVLDHVASPLPAGTYILNGGPLGAVVPGHPLEYAVVDLLDGERAYCPNLFYSSYRNNLEAQMNELFGAWEAYKRDTTIYDDGAMFAPGCALESYLPSVP